MWMAFCTWLAFCSVEKGSANVCNRALFVAVESARVRRVGSLVVVLIPQFQSKFLLVNTTFEPTTSTAPQRSLLTRDPAGNRATPSRRVASVMALFGGVLTTFSVPPFGFWPLAFFGIALLAGSVIDSGIRRRMLTGFLFGLGLYVPSLWWMTAFSLPGGIFVGVLEASITGLAMVFVHRRYCWLSLPVGLIAADAMRSLWPFGGLPLSGIDLGQANGPLAPIVTFGGRLSLIGLTAACGVVLANMVRSVTQRQLRNTLVSTMCVLSIVAIVGLSRVMPNGTHQIGSTKVAAIQGGGPRGTRKTEQGTLRAYQRNVDATATLNDTVDLIVWPENVVDAPVFANSQQLRDLGVITAKHNAPLLAGITEDGPNDKTFRNASVIVNVDGTMGERFDKVRRVPYGEYFPFRSFIGRFATLPVREAVPGTKPGFLNSPAGPLAISISYEAFFDDRSRGGVRAGGQAIINPTNASSYPSTQVPAQQVAASQLRALETRRWVVQVAPTGHSAIIDPNGRVLRKAKLSAATVLVATIDMRTGFTPYVRFNDGPLLALSALVLAACWIADLRGRKTRRLS
jgi:apolipoprotein N-acyltransferase